MPLTVFDVRGIPGHRRERIEAAVVAGGTHASGPHEAWVAADMFRGGVKVIRSVALVDSPHSSDASVKIATPPMKTRLRPKRSASVPQLRISAARLSA